MKRLLFACALMACSSDDAQPLAHREEPLWTQPGNMKYPRTLHRATLLDDGRALVTGGASAVVFPGFASLSAAEVYDGGKFTPTDPMQVGRVLHAAVKLPDGRVMISGGASGLDSGTSSTEIWDPSSGKWSYVASSNSQHAAHTMTLLPDGRVLVVGGFLVKTIEWYEPATDHWTLSTEELPDNLGGHTTTTLTDGRLLIAGGGKDWTDSDPGSYVYDPKTDVLDPLPDLQHARVGHSATLLPDGRVFVFGGAKDGVLAGKRLSSAEVFDPTTSTWKEVAASTHPRLMHVAELLPSGNVLIAGGDPDGILSGVDDSTAEIYDVKQDRWIPAGFMSAGRTAAATIPLGPGKVVVTGGFNGEPQPTVDLFTIVQLGGACKSNSACESGFCADGVCCTSACRGSCEACDASGSCRPIDGTPRAGHATCDAYVCKGGKCLDACSSEGDCASGYDCKEGRCEPNAASACSIDRRVVVAANGVVASCGAYLCESGECHTDCSSTAECAPGYACELEAHRCVSAKTGTTAGGCSYGGSSGTFALGLLFVAILLARRRSLIAGAVLLAPSIAHAEPPAVGAPGDPIATSGYRVDLFQGPVLMSSRATGMGGAFAAIGEGVQGYAVNAAAPAVREAYSRSWFDYDLDVGISFPGAYAKTDFDNDGKPASYNGFYFLTGGANLQFGTFGVGASAQLQNYDLQPSDVALGTGLQVQFVRINALAAKAFFDQQLMIGAGIRTVTLNMNTKGDNPRTLFTASSAGFQGGALFAPHALPMRFALTARGPMTPNAAGNADDVVTDANGSKYIQREDGSRWYMPEAIEYPWEIEAGFALQLGPRPLNTPFVNTHSPPSDDPDAGPYPNKTVRAQRIKNLEDRAKARYKALPREKYLLLASLLVSGPVVNGVGIESFLDRVVIRSGKHVSVTPRVGAEVEPFPNVVQLRAGSYLEPSRFESGSYRPHGTVGFDLRLFEWDVLGLVAEDTAWRIGGSVDISRGYFSWGVTAGMWH